MAAEGSLLEDMSSLQKAIDALSPSSDVSLTSVKCNAKALDGSGTPSVKFLVTPKSQFEPSAASLVFAIHASGISELSVSFDLHCKPIDQSVAITNGSNAKFTEIDTVSRSQESTAIQPTTDANKAEGSTDPSLSKKEDSLSLSEKEINDLSETSPTNPAISPSDVSTIASTAKSKSDAGEELNAEGSPTKTSKVNSVAAVFGGITPTAVAIPFNEYGLFSGVPTKTWYKPLGVVSPFATSDVFDKERDATACPECIVFAHPDGFPLEGRPRPCVHSGGPYHTERGDWSDKTSSLENICSRKTLDGKEISQEELRTKWYKEATRRT